MAGIKDEILYGGNVDFSGGTPTSGQVTEDGQLLIGSTASPNIKVGTLTAPAAGITITNGSGSITFALSNDLAALEGLVSTGLASRTASDTWSTREITGTSNQISVVNGDGVSGNPILSLSSTVVSTTQPAFQARLSSTQSNVTGNNTLYTVICDTETYDQDSNYNNGTGVFTAPITGKYLVTFQVSFSGLSSANFFEMYINTSNRQYRNIFHLNLSGGTEVRPSMTAQVDMDASDTITFQCSVGGESSDTADITGSGTNAVTYCAAYLMT